MKLAIKAAAAAGGMLAALFAGGCGASAGGSGVLGGARPGTVAGCTAYGVYAIEHRITVRWKPAACRGLSRAQINQAAALAIHQLAGAGPKPIWRRRAAEAAPFLDYLITGPVPAASSLPAGPTWSGSSAPASRSLRGRDLAMDVGALVAWLLAALSGAYVLRRWLAHGGTLRRRASATGSPPIVIVGHFGLAAGGLAIWVGYLITGWAALAWTAVGVLLPVAGLGMAALAVGLPGRAPVVAGGAARPADESRIRPGGRGTSRASTAGAGPASTGSISTATADLGVLGTVQKPARRNLSPLIVVGHGVLAVTTMLLILLAALGAAAN